MALESRKLDELYQLVLQLPVGEQQMLANRLLEPQRADSKQKTTRQVLQAARLLAPLPEIVVQARPSIQRTQVIAKGKPLSEIVIEERC